MAVTARTWTSGEVVTAAMMNTLRDDINTLDTGPGFILMARLASNHANTTTTLTDVGELNFAIGASEQWAFMCALHHLCPAAADLKLGLTYPSGATGRYGLHGADAEITQGSALIGTDVALACGGKQVMSTVAGTIVNSTTAGTVQIQAAQNAASGTNTIYANSWIVAIRLL